jgi:hypothetical protein
MSTRTVKLVDPTRNILAIARVVDEGEYYGGTIDLDGAPGDVRALFDEFEEIVNGQIFSLLDEVQEKIASLRIRAMFDDGMESPLRDLQIFPSTGDVSFKLVKDPAGSPLTR